MAFHINDRRNWDRAPYYEHYLSQKCSYSVTANIVITKLIERLQTKKLKFYPAFIYMVSKVVNAHTEFRTCFNNGVLGYWDHMLPSYTIFHNDTKTFSSIWTEFSPDFSVFHHNFNEDMKRYGDVHGFFTKSHEAPNTFPISMVPWVSFTGFNLNINEDNNYLLPILTGGKYFNQDGKTLFPLAVQMHHAVCDGYHVSLFINEVQELADRCEEWIF
ncbi:type A chloramphenicol O-acetyltransferase [Fictibacillus sp. S7]|uniref:type A chloramphenicol O-acetyltransferase n=1 Tax=Fictibacillus sp. S7 TaxID=2212476 RepID=UPI001012888C|nr:type A chloramphenicol O-acetyltransferase [Fictibacillus sp. S7]RXZ01558.1 type A chloramphenicol O-acetyltransferase [Fictibacillus sp. S7]